MVLDRLCQARRFGYSLPRPPLPTRKNHTRQGDPSPVPRWALSLCLRWLRSPSKPGFYVNLLPCSIQQGVGQGQGRRCPVARLQGDRTKRPGLLGSASGDYSSGRGCGPSRLAVQWERQQRNPDLFSRPLHKVETTRYRGIPPKHAGDTRAIGAAIGHLRRKVGEGLDPCELPYV